MLTTNYYLGDCLELTKDLADKSVDMILTDLPYEVTANPDDKMLDLARLWEQYKRVCKGTIALTATMRFASKLIQSNPLQFRYDLVWEKNKVTGFLNAKKMPLRKHELILVFYDKLYVYNPQKTIGHKPVNGFTKHTSDGVNYGATEQGISGGGQTDRYPTSVLKFNVVNNDSAVKQHNNQKPVDMLEWLIRTYTNEGDVVLDSCMGSGSTGIACLRAGRRFIGMEIDPKYFAKAVNRIEFNKRLGA